MTGRAEEIQPRPEKYDEKVNFKDWVNQFEEYTMMGQWSDGRECFVPVPLADWGSADVLRGTAGTRKDGLQRQGRGPPAQVWAGN